MLPDRPYFPSDQLTPVSATPSPNTPGGSDGRRSPFGRPHHGAISPKSSSIGDSEPLSSNLDSPFPPFPSGRPNKAQDEYGSLGGGRYAENDSMYAPISPRTAVSGGLLQRMNTIAPGPFDVSNRWNTGSSDEVRGHRRQVTADSSKNMTLSAAEAGDSIPRPSTAGPGHKRTLTNSSNGSKSGIAPPRLPRKNGYGGFGPPGSEESTKDERPAFENRSQTFPIRKEGREEFFRRPSESGINHLGQNMVNEDAAKAWPGTLSLSPSVSQPRRQNPSVSGPDLTRPLPPRRSSLLKVRIDSISHIPASINLAAEFGIGNPYHTPSESQSSDASGYSDQSKASSRSSPPLSVAPSRSRSPVRRPSDATKIDVLMADLESSMFELQPRDISSNRPPPNRTQYHRPLPPAQKFQPPLLSPGSPFDPVVPKGRLSPILQSRERSLSPSSTMPPGEKTRRPSTLKGDCKGCSEPIKGKSVSSADGRLTGRYHKQCFVCTTCLEPFQTATFYVIRDAPYCERHYHKLNGSVCTTCDKGIEGQYLESERKQKFHPNCLTCADCKRNLRSDYFEMNGRVYCERDAFRRTQQQRFLGPGMGGTNRMERRTTRMMMM
jgi:uncharacterized CHY-type Zn-finger protein